MTNKEAIEILKPLTEYSVDKNGIATFPMVSTPLQAEALDLAIKALEQIDLIKFNIHALNKLIEEAEDVEFGRF